MPDDVHPADCWPRFELVTFSTPTGIPHGWDEELVRKGVPKALIGQAYKAARELQLLEVSQNGQFIRFGVSGLFGNVCLDPRTGAVVDITYLPAEYSNAANLPSGVHGSPTFVNSGLEQFIASVRTVLNRFPFDSGKDAEDDELVDEWEHAAEELTETLGDIDPAAVADLDGFWMTFVADVQMGSFSTEDVLSDTNE